MQVADVRRALADAMRDNVVSDPILTVYPYHPDSVSVPCAYVQPGDITFDKSMVRGMDEMALTVTVLVSKTDDRASQDLLDGYVSGGGPASIKAAMESARGAPGEFALDGACDDFRVERVTAYQYYIHNEVRYLGAQFFVKVIGPGGSP